MVKMFPHNCPECKNDFEHKTPYKVYCSNACYRVSIDKKKITKRGVGTCLTCQKEFTFMLSVKELRKYCSRECGYVVRRTGHFKFKKTCIQCRGEFKVFPSQLKRKYCSHQCSGKSMKKD